ncbi:Uncharacterised protein [Leclercia adecarboxylata]|uniref:Uncharacterized protein n=1 Tax=Leclercia adecarboxylata TaxID=83655 RepID=A0A4U9HVH0_9ENTR|nr:Uncharacterised protein [Leclercia adecarboxylata]
MLQIAFLLAGATFVRKAAPFFMVAGLLWGGLGLAIFLDGLQGGLHFPCTFLVCFCCSTAWCRWRSAPRPKALSGGFFTLRAAYFC